ncbi:unnamed protein product [Chironomus riparius]|uniref:Uncharacterized protein n=1 Tax=Chironomus riparius TaxID=315576 RepID=A0A9N9S5M3_9DIPT|nr:unnamed protein product [Chironomus riparius]
MKFQLVIFLLAAIVFQIANSKPSTSSADDSDEISDVVEEMIKVCKAKSCKKEDILKEVQTAVESHMKSVKPGELKRDEVLKDIDALAKHIGENEVIKGSEMKEFLLGMMKKYEDKFGAAGATTATTKKTK